MVMLREVFVDNPKTVFLYNFWLTCQGRWHDQIKSENADGGTSVAPYLLQKMALPNERDQHREQSK